MAFFPTRLSPHPPPRQSSLTLIEVAMVLAIAAVVIWGVMTLYLSTSNSRKNTESITAVVSGAQRLMALLEGAGPDYQAITSDNIFIHRAKILPEHYWVPDPSSAPAGSGKYVLPNGASVTAYHATGKNGHPNIITMSLTFKDAESCMAMGKENIFADSLLVQYSDAGGQNHEIRARDANGKITFKLDGLVQACARPATGDMRINWSFAP